MSIENPEISKISEKAPKNGEDSTDEFGRLKEPVPVEENKIEGKPKSAQEAIENLRKKIAERGENKEVTDEYGDLLPDNKDGI